MGLLGIGISIPTSKLHVYSTTSSDGLAIDGSGDNPLIRFRRNGSDTGAMGSVGSASSYYAGTAVDDLVIRADSGRLHLGVGVGAGAGQQLVLTATNVGIGTTNPNQGELEVKGGTVCVDTNNDNNATSCIANESDGRLKTNVQTYGNALDTLLSLRGVRFDWKVNDPTIVAQHPLITRFGDRPNDLGVIAQEVMGIVPEAISRETIDGFYQVDYDRFIPILIEGAKEQYVLFDNFKTTTLSSIDGLNLEMAETGDLLGVTIQNTETQIADQDILIGQLDANLTAQTGHLMDQENQIASMGARLDSIEARVSDTEAIVTSLQDRVSSLESLMAMLSATDSGILATGSGQILGAQSGDIIADSLTVMGSTNLSTLGVTGEITNGLLVINGFNDSGATPEATLTTLVGPLHLQHDGANPIDLMAGKIRVDVNGNMLIKKGDIEVTEGDVIIKQGSLKGSEGMRGIDIVITEGATEHLITFPTANDTNEYALSVLPTWFTTVRIEEKTVNGFRVIFDSPAPPGAQIDWLIIE